MLHRLAKREDLGFVVSLSVRSWKDSKANKKRSAERMRELLSKIMDDPHTKIFVAYPDGLPNVLVGFFVVSSISSETVVLHTSFVKKIYRRQGVFEDFMDKLKNKGFVNLVLLFDQVDTDKVVPLLQGKFEVIDKRMDWSE